LRIIDSSAICSAWGLRCFVMAVLRIMSARAPTTRSSGVIRLV
jgi:hypothetical protein